MRKSQIKVGGVYNARIGSFGVREDVVVRVDSIDVYANGAVTHYKVTEVSTGKDLSACFPNARNFISAVEEDTSPASANPGPLESTDEAVEAAVAAHDATEGEQGSDPTMSTVTATSATSHSTETASEARAAQSVMVPVQAAPTSNLAARIAATRTGRQVGTPVAGMVPNEEQEAILEVAAEPKLKALVISAGAGCLAGDTIIHVNRAGKGFQIPIKQLVHMQSGRQSIVFRERKMGGIVQEVPRLNHAWDMTIPTMVARADGEVIRLCKLKAAWSSGDKQTFTISTETGRSIRATEIHPFLTGSGEWKKLSELRVGDVVQVNSGRSVGTNSPKAQYKCMDTKFHPQQVCKSKSRSRFAVATHRLVMEAHLNNLTLREYVWILRHNQSAAAGLTYLPPEKFVHHKNENTKDNDLSNLEVVDGQKGHSLHHEWEKNVLWQVGCEKITSIETYGVEATYDIEVEDDPHNFIANGFVVHNTGKTAVLKMLEQVLRGRGQYTAFNKALVEESRAKFTKASVATTHSLAFRAVGRRYSHRLGGDRMRSGQVARILQIDPLILEMQGEVDSQGLPRTKTLSAEFLAGQVLVAVRRFCQSADPCIGRGHLKWIDGVDVVVGDRVSRENQEIVREYLEPFLRTAWADLCHLEGRLPFDHDCYVKIFQLGQGVDRPIIGADYILLDEAQDTAPVFLDIIQRQEHALLVMVGDENQQIYEWRGAVNAMAAFRGAPRRVLSQSYRFGQTIADVANSVLATLEEPTDLVMRGMPGMPSRVAELDRAGCYLYRTNAGAVGRVMLSLKEGLRPHLIGGGADVVRWCQAAIDLKATGKTSHPDLCCFDSWGEVEEYSKTDEGQDIRLMVKLIKEFTAEAIRDALRDMPDEGDADLVVSTVHKSKGREWDTVKLGPDFPVANKMQDADRRLLYVGATRAKLTLDISECPPFCGGNNSRDTGSAETSGAWVPGLEVEYTVPMPTLEDQKVWKTTLNAIKKRADEVGITHQEMGRRVGQYLDKAEANPAPSAPPAAVKFTWCKYDDKWCARGPINTPVGTKIEVERRDGTKQAATIREVVKEYGDAWIYRI